MEILSPAGDYNSLVAAVRCGANAVYLGLNKFNARKNAQNFTEEDFINAVKYLKTSGVKCYVTLNTLIKNNEFKGAVELALFCYNNGADGLILQDIGLIEYLHKNYPQIRMHASTQLSVHNAAALPLLKSLGIKRVVLARELSFEEIKEITAKAKKLNIETEIFVHGALCMSVSGQCLMSASLGGRSANRGLCAGTCRLPFKINNTGNQYCLSLKDLCLIDNINQIKSLGVTSLKIEGRMKNEEYVAAATYSYYCALNNMPYNLEQLKNTFSRSGFTNGYFKNQISNNMFGIRSNTDKIASKNTLNEIHNLYRHQLQSLPLNINIVLNNKEFLATANYKNITVKINGDTPQKANNKPITHSYLKEKFSKLGGTSFYLNNFSANIESGLFVNNINGVKEKLIAALVKKLSNFTVEPLNINLQDFLNLNNSLNINTNKNQLILNYRSAGSYSEELLNNKNIIAAALPLNEIKKINKNAKTAVALPRYIASEQDLINTLKEAKNLGIKYALITNISQILPAKEMGFLLLGDIGLNVFNSFSYNYFSKYFLYTAVSAELSENEILNLKNNVNNSGAMVFSYGRLPLMVAKCCPIKYNSNTCKNCQHSLTDRLNVNLYVCCQNGYTEIFNNKITHTAKNMGMNILLFTNENPQEANNIINQYLTNNFAVTKNNTKALFKNGVI